MSTEYGVFLGLDVGKSDHHAVGLAPDGKRLHDAPLPSSQSTEYLLERTGGVPSRS